jgi:threonylcarbamoyladenosine tRNA methylthiotransferase MtaB
MSWWRLTTSASSCSPEGNGSGALVDPIRFTSLVRSDQGGLVSLRVYLESMGCRLNSAEAESLAREAVGAGCEVVTEPAHADVIVLNSCAVTAEAVRKSRHRVRALHRANLQAEVAVTGCWATASPDSIRSLRGVRWVTPNSGKADLMAQLLGGDPGTPPAPWAPGRWGHTRAFIGVQDGCDHACTYCVTRLLRGPAHSRSPDETLAAVRHAVAGGAQEVVLTGVSLGAYGRDLALDDGLATLVRTILTETPLPRLRLSSIEPWDVTQGLIELWLDPRLCRQLHLPLQSGSDAVLKRMGRGTTVDGYRALVAAIRAVSPEIAVTTDLIAGFPGETEDDFRATVALVEALRFARLHVFPYSERAGTAATRSSGAVAVQTRRARAQQLRDVGRRLADGYRERFVGRMLPVLWEPRGRDGAWVGWTDTYLLVRTWTSRELYNAITDTVLERVEGEAFVGRVVDARDSSDGDVPDIG